MSASSESVMTLFDVPQMDQDQYERVIQSLTETGAGAIPGQLYHIAGPSDNGWVVVDVWKTSEDFHRFAERLMPALQEHRVAHTQPRVVPVHNAIDPQESRENEHRATLEEARTYFNSGNLESYLQTLYAPDAVLHFLPPGLPQGHEGARMFYNGFLSAFPDAQLVYDDVIVSGDLTTIRFHVDMTHRGEFQGLAPTNKHVVMSGITILRFAEGRVAERWSESDFAGLMMQLGALPATA